MIPCLGSVLILLGLGACGAGSAPTAATGTPRSLDPAPTDIRFDDSRDYPAARYSTGGGPGAILSADFNGDARPDLAVADTSGQGPVILLNDGSGGFAAPLPAPSGGDAPTLATGDFNEDGKADLAVGSYLSGNVAVLLGRGDGSFEPGGQYPGVPQPSQFAVADFNNDGHTDLVVINSLPGIGRLLLGDGAGSFASDGQTLTLGAIGLGVFTADLNTDGWADLAVTDGAGLVEVLLGLGEGRFAAPAIYPVGLLPEYIAAADLDGDGVLDLAVANALSNDLSLLYGLGDGSFRPQVSLPGGEAAGGLGGRAGLWVDDFDHDGLPDIASTSVATQRMAILQNRGGGQFEPVGEYPVSGSPETCIGDDFDGDGYTDLAVPGNIPLSATDPLAVVGNAGTTAVSILLNTSAAP